MASAVSPVVGMLRRMDLYRQARLFPRTLSRTDRGVLYGGLEAAGITRSAASWRSEHGRATRLVRGAYVLGATPPDLADRARAALAVGGRHCVVAFHTAAALHGFGVFEDPAVHLVVPAGCSLPTHRGIRVHQTVVPVQPVLWNGIPCTTSTRTAVDLARTLERIPGLAVLDAALAAQVCDHDGLLEEVARHQRCRGFRRAAALVPLADGRSECRQETHLRLILHDAGLREFEPQVEVYNRNGELVYRLDLADRGRLVAVEYDGASHLERGRLREDRERHNWLDGHGWRMRYFTDRDLYRYPARIVHQVMAARNGR